MTTTFKHNLNPSLAILRRVQVGPVRWLLLADRGEGHAQQYVVCLYAEGEPEWQFGSYFSSMGGASAYFGKQSAFYNFVADDQDRDGERITELLRKVSAFHDFDELLISVGDHNYTPTLLCNHDDDNLNAAVLELRKALTDRGIRIYPPTLDCEKPEAKDVARIVPAKEAKQQGFARFNSGPHLCVDVPDGHFTIAAKTSEGRVITFAFCPYTKEGAAQCCDVQVHDTGKTVKNGADDLDVQHVLGFSVGSNAFQARPDDGKKPCTLTSFILQKHQPSGDV